MTRKPTEQEMLRMRDALMKEACEHLESLLAIGIAIADDKEDMLRFVDCMFEDMRANVIRFYDNGGQLEIVAHEHTTH